MAYFFERLKHLSFRNRMDPGEKREEGVSVFPFVGASGGNREIRRIPKPYLSSVLLRRDENPPQQNSVLQSRRSLPEGESRGILYECL